MDFSHAAIAIDMMAKPVTRHFMGSGSYDGTNWDAGTPAIEQIQAVVHAPTQQDIRDLPEGIVADVRWTMWTRAQLNISNDDLGLPTDEIEWQGQRYRIPFIWPRREGGYTKAALGIIRDRGRSLPDRRSLA